MDELRQILDVAQLGTNALLIGGMGILWKKLSEVLRQKDEAMQATIEILKELAKNQ